MELPSALFKRKLKKVKHSTPPPPPPPPHQNFIFREIELFYPKIKKFLIFSQKKAFLIFQEAETRENSLYFSKWNFFIFRKTSYISGSKFPSSKNEKHSL